MSEKKIEVITYSGYKEGEKPKAFFLQRKRIEVKEILNMWIEEGAESRIRKRFFKVKGSDGNIHEIYCDVKTLEWFYSKR